MSKNWYAVLTADLLYDKNLTAQQKILVAVINNLRNENGYCFAGNRYLSEALGVSQRTVQRELQKLEEEGYIGRVVEVDERGEVKHRFLTVNESKVPPMSNLSRPHVQSVVHNNKVNNRDINISFVQFWNLYDKKVGRHTAEKKWNRLKDSERTAIMSILRDYVRSTPDKTYRPNATTFLNQRRWEDEITKDNNQRPLLPI